MPRRKIKLLEKARVRAVWIALAANVSMSCVKLISAYWSGSRVLWSESLHSVADSVNSIMLLIGIWTSRKPADSEHPYGYGKDAYFWALIAAVFMLGVISTGSILLGYDRVAHPGELLDLGIALIGLMIAIALESVAVFFAASALLQGAAIQLKRKARFSDLGTAFRHSEFPNVKLVFVEDMMSLTGAIVAFTFILLVHLTGIHSLDGWGAIVIGFMLGGLALMIAMENRDKLIGESASASIMEEIEKVAANYPKVQGIAELKTMVIGPNQLLVNMTVELDPELEVVEVDDITAEIERRVCRRVPQVKEMFIEVIADEDEMEPLEEPDDIDE